MDYENYITGEAPEAVDRRAERREGKRLMDKLDVHRKETATWMSKWDECIWRDFTDDFVIQEDELDTHFVMIFCGDNDYLERQYKFLGRLLCKKKHIATRKARMSELEDKRKVLDQEILEQESKEEQGKKSKEDASKKMKEASEQVKEAIMRIESLRKRCHAMEEEYQQLQTEIKKPRQE